MTKDSPGVLKLSSPNVLSFIGVLVMVLGCSILGLTKTTTLRCDRPSNIRSKTLECKVIETILFGQAESNRILIRPVTQVSGVAPDPQNLEQSDSHKLQIGDSESLHSVKFGAGINASQVAAAASLIETAIANPQSPRITIPLTSPWLPYLPGAGVVLVGALYGRRPGSWFEINKNAGVISIKRHDIIPAIKLPIYTVKAIVIEKARFTGTRVSIDDEPGHSRLGYRISLVLASGKIEPFTKNYSEHLKSKRHTAETIQAFLQLPPVEEIGDE